MKRSGNERAARGRAFCVSLRVKAMTGAAILIATSSTAIGLTILGVTHKQMEHDYRGHVRLTIESVAHALTAATERTLHVATRTAGIVFVARFDRAGELVDFVTADRADEPLRSRVGELGPSRLLLEPLVDSRGAALAFESAEMESDLASDVDGGTLAIGYTLAPVETEYAPIRARVLATIVGVGLATALLAWLVARAIVGPIHALVDGTRRVAKGDFSRPVVVKSRDELELLAESFNKMSAELEQARHRLGEHKQLLADAVRERTRRLRDAYAELKVLDQMKDGFLSSISHEFRTPITSIRAFSELLEQDRPIEAGTVREFGAIIRKESDQLARLVSNVLDLVRIESGEMPFRCEPVDPAAVAREAIAQTAEHAADRDVTVEFAAPPTGDATWDGPKITRLLCELLENAIRFTPPGGHVRLALESTAERIRFDVRDDGPGIPLDALESVFAKFRQSGTVLTDKPRGQGLGLPICRLIAKRHGGSVKALASRGGAHLVVELPRVAAPEPAELAHA